jgi:hypothetical protein
MHQEKNMPKKEKLILNEECLLRRRRIEHLKQFIYLFVYFNHF